MFAQKANTQSSPNNKKVRQHWSALVSSALATANALSPPCVVLLTASEPFRLL